MLGALSGLPYKIRVNQAQSRVIRTVKSDQKPSSYMKINYGVLAAVILFSGSMASFGQTKTWTGAGDGVSWTNGSNWSGGTVPGPANDVAITSGADSGVVISASDVTVRSIQCGKAFTISGRTLTLTGGASQFSGTFTISNNAALKVNGVGSSVTASGATVAADNDFYATSGGVIHLPNLKYVVNNNQNGTWRADGAGSLIDLSSVTNLTLGYYRALYVQAYNGGAVDLHRVGAAAGAVQVDASDAGTVVDLSGLAGRWTSPASSDLMLHAQTGAAILIPNVTQLEYAALRVDDTGTISTAQLNLLTNVALTVDGSVPNFGRVTNIDDCDIYALNGGVARLTNVFRVSNGNQSATWRADGAGSLVDLPLVTNVTLGYYRALYVQAYDGGMVDLHRLTSAAGAVQVDAQDPGTFVDLSGIAGRWTSLGSSDLILHAQTGASILIPNVTQLEYASLRVDDTGTISTAQLNLLTNVALTVDGSVPDFGRVTNIDDCDIIALGGGVARLTNVFWVTDGNQNPTWRADGAGSLVDLSSLTGVTVGYYRALYVQAYNGGEVDLRRLNSLSTGSVQVTADGTGSVMDLSTLSGFVSVGSSSSSLTARNGGIILLNNQAFLLANVAINIPPGNPVLPPTLTASSTLTLYGQPWHSYWVEKRDTLSSTNPWVFVARIPLTAALQPLIPVPGANTEYRVWEFIADPPLLDLFSVAGHQAQCVIYDAPGKTNQLLTAVSVAPGATWQPGAVTVMTNSFRILAPAAASDPQRFYRAKRL